MLGFISFICIPDKRPCDWDEGFPFIISELGERIKIPSPHDPDWVFKHLLDSLKSIMYTVSFMALSCLTEFKLQ